MVRFRALFSGQKVKGKVTRVVGRFCRVCSVAPSLSDWFTLYVVHKQPRRWRCVAHHFWVKRSKVKVTRFVRRFCRVCSWAPSLLDWFNSYVVHTTHEVTMCRARFLCQSQRSRSHGSFKGVSVSASWLRPFLIDSINVWYIYDPCRYEVSRTISGSKGQRSMSHRSFEDFAVSTPWLRPFLTDSLHMWYTNNPWGDNVPFADCSYVNCGPKGCRSYYIPRSTCSFYSLHIWHNYMAWCINIASWDQCFRLPIPELQVKGVFQHVKLILPVDILKYKISVIPKFSYCYIHIYLLLEHFVCTGTINVKFMGQLCLS